MTAPTPGPADRIATLKHIGQDAADYARHIEHNLNRTRTALTNLITAAERETAGTSQPFDLVNAINLARPALTDSTAHPDPVED